MLFPHETTMALWIWVAALVVGLGLRMQHMQKHETESDLRAVALTGNPEALVRALTKLNALSHLPRRWASNFERRATHPSLARRIQAIRGTSNTPSATLSEAAVFAAANGAARVTFHGDRLEWKESSTTSHEFAYDSLSELRMDASASDPRLVAIDSSARRWECTIAGADVARAQATLDAVDGCLGKPAAAAPVPAMAAFSPTRVIAWLAMVLAVGAGHIAVAIPGILAVLRPASQLAGAAGAAVLTAAVLGWRDRTEGPFGEVQIWLDVILALCGAALVVMAFVNRRDQAEPRGEKLLTVVALSASLVWTIVAFSGMAPIDLYRNLREWPSAPVLTLACAGGVAFAGSRTARVAFLSATALGLVSIFIGSTVFANSFIDDPFVAEAPAIVYKSVPASSLREQSIAFEPSSVWVSPNGTHIAFSSEDDQENVTIHAGPVGGTLARLTADQAAFVNDNRLLVLERETRGSVLHLVDLDASARELWSTRLPLRATALAVDRTSARWHLLGLDQAGHIASAEGRFDDSVVRHSVWPLAGEKGTSARPVTAARGTVLALESRSLFSPLDRISRRTMFLFPHFRVETRLWSLAGRDALPFAKSLVEVSCPESSVMNEPAMCMGFDGTSTRFFRVDPEMQQLVPVASAAGRFHAQSEIARGWLAGWMNGVPVLLHASTAEAIRMPESISDRVYQLAMGDTVFAALSWGTGTSTLRIYPKPQISN